MDDVLKKIKHFENLLLVLDYDGTLLDFVDHPSKAILPRNKQEMLSKINVQPNVKLIINTGRTSSQMDEIIADKQIDIIADHGLSHRVNTVWKHYPTDTIYWKSKVRSFMQQVCRECPGSFIEEKSFSICWHYRPCEEKIGLHYAEKVHEFVNTELNPGNPRILKGKKVVEVIAAEANKGEIIRQTFPKESDTLYVGIGDDITDEDMFTALQEFEEHLTIKVGPGNTSAEYRIDNWKNTWDILKKLVS